MTSRRRTGAEGEESGLGLGFFIAKTLLERSGATVAFLNRPAPEKGAVVRVRWARQISRRRDRGTRGPLEARNAVRIAMRMREQE